MKKLLLFFVCCLLGKIGLAQNYMHTLVGADTIVWTATDNEPGYTPYQGCWFDIYMAVPDSTNPSPFVKKLLLMSYVNCIEAEQYDMFQDFGTLREDTAGQKVYFKLNSIWVNAFNFPLDTMERVIYDYSLNVGDSFYVQYPFFTTEFPLVVDYGWGKVDSITTRQTVAGPRKNIHLSSLDNPGSWVQEWVEGIGMLRYSEDGEFLNCCFKNNVHVFKVDTLTGNWPQYVDQNMLDTTCFYGNGCPEAVKETALPTAGVACYPNPANDELTIEADASAGGIVSVAIINAIGQTVYQARIGAVKTVLPIGRLPEGIYTAIVTTPGGRVALSFNKQGG